MDSGDLLLRLFGFASHFATQNLLQESASSVSKLEHIADHIKENFKFTSVQTVRSSFLVIKSNTFLTVHRQRSLTWREMPFLILENVSMKRHI